MRNNMQKGFTLIELVVVIVILGILAATALPRFIDLTGDANNAVINGFAGAINGGNSINYAAYLARRTSSNGSTTTAGIFDTSTGCTIANANKLLGPSSQLVSPPYTVAGTTTAGINTDNNCTLVSSSGTTTANFVMTNVK
jgi:MSHA pilin protein MshA